MRRLSLVLGVGLLGCVLSARGLGQGAGSWGWQDHRCHPPLCVTQGGVRVGLIGSFQIGAETLLVGASGTAASNASNSIALQRNGQWETVTGGMGGRVVAAASWDDGSGPSLYLATFDGITTFTGSLWRFDGVTLSLVLGPMPWFYGTALQPYDDGTGSALFIGGSLPWQHNGQTFNSLAKWDGVNLLPMGSGLDFAFGASAGTCQDLEVFDGGSGPQLIVGGIFDSVDGFSANCLAAWDGQSWSLVGGGISGSNFNYFANSQVFALEVADDGNGEALWVAGDFVNAGPIVSRNLARWDGALWQGHGTFGGGALTQVQGYRGRIYIAGNFVAVASANGPFATMPGWNGFGIEDGFAWWDGQTWSAPYRFRLGYIGIGCLIAHDDGEADMLYAGAAGLIDNIEIYPYGAGVLRLSTDPRNNPAQSIALGSPGPTGTPTTITCTGLVPGRHYYNVFSPVLNPEGVGFGPYFGLSAVDPWFLAWQLEQPLGAHPFHFVATGNVMSFGPYDLPTMVVEGVCFEHTNGVFGQVSPVTRFSIP